MKFVTGVDEAGRGSIAGPVAVGFARCTEEIDLLAMFAGLDDSKKLSPSKREKIMDELEARVAAGDPLAFAVIYRDASAIDQQGIVVCIRQAIEEGLTLFTPTGTVLLDGSLHAPTHYEQQTIIRGDSLIPAIMLASIVAKVSRDRRMEGLHNRYPDYDFAQHKGYGTRAHYEALHIYGPCEIHRSSFLHLDQ